MREEDGAKRKKWERGKRKRNIYRERRKVKYFPCNLFQESHPKKLSSRFSSLLNSHDFFLPFFFSFFLPLLLCLTFFSFFSSFSLEGKIRHSKDWIRINFFSSTNLTFLFLSSSFSLSLFSLSLSLFLNSNLTAHWTTREKEWGCEKMIEFISLVKRMKNCWS